jgi:hypothetical protein
MDSNKSVTATFSTMPPLWIVNIAPNYFQTLLDAYAAAQDGTSITIDARAVELPDVYFDLSRNVSVTLKGGYDGSFNGICGYTTLHGILTVMKGSLVVDSVILK